MAVLFAEGFTGVPRGTTQMATPDLPIKSLGWKPRGLYNGATAINTGDTGNNIIIAADDIFADRSKMTMSAALGNTAVTSYLQQYTMPLDTRGYEKFVIGMMVMLDTNTTTNGELIVTVSGPTPWPSTNSNFPVNEFYAQIVLPNDAVGTNGSLYVFNVKQTDTPLIKKGKPVHVEILIEDDEDRCRVYLDGVLCGDATHTGSFASAAGGFSVCLSQTAPAARTFKGDVSNVYVLGLDAIHTGVLGPAARVLEIPPPGDMEVMWLRPDGFSSNAAVLAQMFNHGSPNYIAARDVGDYDVYSAPNAVAANAAQVFGAGIRVNAMSMAPGTHTIKPVVKTASGVTEIGTTGTLQLGTLTPFFMDASKNPDTNAAWTPSAVSSAGFGFKLKS